ncbi:MAG: response regulator [Anaeromyxobacteraceae bacterium]|nr:response regulator [Anaeromyxobacteraceae bacterium]
MKDAGAGEPGALAPQVYLLDDDELVLRTLTRVLRRAGYRVAAFSSPRAFLTGAALSPPCCVLLDVHMPEMGGEQIQQKIQATTAPPPIVFISGGSDIPTSVRVMKAGAVDFLPKPFANKDLLAAVAGALGVAEERCRAGDGAREARARLARLTPREREVCDGVARGLKSKEIAAELGAAVKTVNVHRSRVMAKLGVSSVAALVKLVDRAGGRS